MPRDHRPVLPGLDLSREIEQVEAATLGDTLVFADDAGFRAMAVCHVGPGTEAGSGACYVKFGAVRPGPDAGRSFERLLDGCDALAVSQRARC